MVSSDLLWQLTKKNNSFLIKRQGAEFSCEKNNLVNLNSPKFSGLIHRKTVSMSADPEKGVVLTTRLSKVSTRKPAKAYKSTTLKRGARRNALSVVNLVTKSGYRPDLKRAALARLTAVTKSMRKPKQSKKPSRRAVRAAKLEASSSANLI
jgi:large subunit ribosomal protein L28e